MPDSVIHTVQTLNETCMPIANVCMMMLCVRYGFAEHITMEALNDVIAFYLLFLLF